MITVSEAAHTLIGTPYRHGGRVSGRNGGIDCIGVVVVSYKMAGFDIGDVKGYNMRSMNGEILKKAREFCETVFVPREGDIIIMRYHNIPHHAAIYCGEGRIIHASLPCKKVVKCKLDEDRLVGVFRPWQHLL